MRNALLSLLNNIALRGIVMTAFLPVVNLQADDAPAQIKVQNSHAQTVTQTSASTVPVISPGEVQATPEMWFYEQAIRRYDDPKNAVRAAAEFKANQRRARMAAMEWYGYSNLRPASGIDPFAGPLSPTWIGNGYYPQTWVSPSRPMSVWVIPGVISGY